MRSLINLFLQLFGLASPPRSNPIATSSASSTRPGVNSSINLGPTKKPPLWYVQKMDTGLEIGPFNPNTPPKEIDLILERLTLLVQEITPAPSASFKIYQKLQDDETPTKELAEMASGDPVLAARILKCVNSAFFGLSSEVTSISQAILLLGMNQLRVLLLSEGLKVDFNGVERELQDKIAQHSAVTSVITFQLARGFSNFDAGMLRTVALIHDMGRILLRSSHSDRLRAEFSDEYPLELRISMVGAAFAQSWGMSKDFANLILLIPFAQIFGIQEVPYGYRRQVALLGISHVLARNFGFGDDEELLALDPQSWEILDLNSNPKQWINTDIAAEMHKVSQLF